LSANYDILRNQNVVKRNIKMNIKEINHPPALDRFVTHAGQQIRETADQLTETAARAGEGLEENLDDIKIKFNNVRDSVTGKTKEYSRTLNGYITKNPWVAVGISAGFAFLVGVLVGRRRDD
jgi:ElaB/YqjD/DUF883 family membrane-anchored ribosome-binding protein